MESSTGTETASTEAGNRSVPSVDKIGQPLQRPVDTTPRQLLEKTVAAYQSTFSYSDHAQVRIVAKMLDPEAEPEPWPCTVAFQKPGRLRLEVNEGKLVSDGTECFAQIRPMPDQVLRFPTPQSWTLEALFQDIYLDQAMEVGIPETILRFPPQLILLFAKDPLKTLLPEGAHAEFRDPKWIDDVPCDLIRITNAHGQRLLWISRKNHALVRFDYFVEGLPVPEGIDSLRMIRIEMTDARFNWEIAPEAFQMQQPMDARLVTEFQPGETALFGRILDSPETMTLQVFPQTASDGPEEKSVSVAELAEKTVVLCFWSIGGESSRGALSEMLKVREMFIEDDRVRFFAVNLDAAPGEPANAGPALLEQIRKTLGNWQLSWAPIRESDGRFSEKLLIDAVPSLVILGPKGTVEFYYRGTVSATNLGDAVRSILSGEKPYEEGLAHLARQREEHRSTLRSMTVNDYYADSMPAPDRERIRGPAPAKTPDRFELELAWSRPLTGAAHVAVLPGENQGAAEGAATGLLVPYEGNLLALIDPAGNILKTGKPDGLPGDEMVTVVRTGIGPGGHRFVGVSSVSGRAVHVYDGDLKPVVSYYPDQGGKETTVSQSPRQVVADFRFTDIYGNGTLALLLGIISLDVTVSGDSLRAVDLQGKEIWRDESISSPFQVNVRISGGQRDVLSLGMVDKRSSLLNYDANGKRRGVLNIGEGRQVLWFDVDDVRGDGQSELCVISADLDGSNVRIESFGKDEKMLWSRSLPAGEHEKPVEQIVTGDLLGDAVKEWIVTAPDGTIFVFGSDGTPLDSFSFGKFPTGLAVLRDAGQCLLVVADVEGITAWNVVAREP